MSNYLYDIVCPIIKDGYGETVPMRQIIRYVDGIIADDPIKQETVITISGASSTIGLATVLTNSNTAQGNTITGLGSPVFDQDATTKAYVDGYVTNFFESITGSDQQVISGTVPTGTSKHLLGTITSPANGVYVLKVYSTNTQRWSVINVNFSVNGFFAYENDFQEYQNKTIALNNGLELNIEYTGGNASVYIWQNPNSSNIVTVQANKEFTVPIWMPPIIGAISTGVAYQLLGVFVPQQSSSGKVLRLNIQDSFTQRNISLYLNYRYSGTYLVSSVDGVDSYATQYTTLLASGLSIRFIGTASNIEVHILQDGNPKTVSVWWEIFNV